MLSLVFALTFLVVFCHKRGRTAFFGNKTCIFAITKGNKHMKLVIFSGGLGNQMFQYAFYEALKANYRHVYFTLAKINHYKEHNGYELNRVFGISQSRSEKVLTKLLSMPLLKSIVKHLFFRYKYRERDYYTFDSYRFFFDRSKVASSARFTGYWQSDRYFESIAPLIKQRFSFREDLLSASTRIIRKEMNKGAVSVHIRRGDYLADSISKNYGEICTLDYYQKAIDYIKTRTVNPVFYIFSNDIEWCKKHLPDDIHILYVECNQRGNSWQDMFLMTCCHHNIVANSSFSWWGAYLNAHPDKIVIAPKTWVNTTPAPDATPKDWIRL